MHPLDYNTGSELLSLPLEAIRPNPRQPRQRFDERGLDELAVSIREHGLLQPVLVRPLDDDTYELVAGERRWQAARRAGLSALPALALDASPQRVLELALIENIQRADLTPLEEAEAYRTLMTTLGLTQERLAERLGISRVAVANRVRLLTLSIAARQALLEGRISEGHARALLALHNDRQAEAVARVVAGGLTVRETEQLVRRMIRGKESRPRGPDLIAETLAEKLRDATGAQVKVRRSGGGINVLIRFHSEEAAHHVIEALMPREECDDL